MVNENTKSAGYSITTLDDIEEIKDVIEYCRGLIIKSQELADYYETITSLRNGTIYVSAIYKLTDDELNRRVIIDNYIERNDYYKWLYDNYGIPYAEARVANDYKILKVLNKTLSTKDEILFNECYNDTLTYAKQTFYTKAFNNQGYHRQYFLLNILSMTVQKYITRKLEFYFDIDYYNERDLKNSFISYGFDYFDGLPLNYQRRILKLLNELVISKGTNADMRKILDIFGNKNIDIYKYILSKLYPIDSNGEYDYDNPYLVFYKTLADGIIDYENDLVIGYDQVTEDDPFWKVDKEEVLYNRVYNKDTEQYEIINSRNFNTIISKYMSIDVSMNLLENSMKLSSLYNFVYQMEMMYKDRQDETSFGFYNRDMSSELIGLFEGIMGLTSLILRSQGLTDNVKYFLNLNQVNLFNKEVQDKDKNNDSNGGIYSHSLNGIKETLENYRDNVINKKIAKNNMLSLEEEKENLKVYGFSVKDAETFRLYNKIKTDGRNTVYGMDNFSNNKDIQEFLDAIQILLIQNKDELERDKKYTELYKFFRNFNMYNFNTPLDANSINEIYGIVNESNSLSILLNNGLSMWSSDIALVEYLKNEDYDVIDKLNYIRQHIILGKCEARYIQQYEDLKELFQRYVYLEGYRNPDTRIIENNSIIIYNQTFRSDVESFLDNIDEDNYNITEAYQNNDMTGMFDNILKYTMEHRNSLKEKYNFEDTSSLDIYLLSDKKDVTYYKELYAIMELFYLPFKDDNLNYENKKYGVTDFINVYQLNEKLRDQLIEFIYESENYHLYRLYNAVFYAKFIKIRNCWGNSLLNDELLEDECYDIIKEIMESLGINPESLEKRDMINFLFDINNARFVIGDKQPYFLGLIDTITDYEKDITFSDIVKKYNSEFYTWLFPTDEELVDMTDDEKEEFYRNKIFELSESLDTAMGSDVFQNFPFAGLLDYITQILYLLCTIFKSFTVDLIQSDTILKMGSTSDKAFNTIKLFDEISDFLIVEEEDQFKDTLRLIDVFSECIYMTVDDNKDDDESLALTDTYKITIEDE